MTGTPSSNQHLEWTTVEPQARINNVDRDAQRVAPGPLRALALIWGAIGFLGLLSWALIRLGPLVADSLALPWAWFHWALFGFNLVAMAWFEGYRGFQQNYAPRFAARCEYLYRHATPMQVMIAPLVCMGFVNAPKRRVLTAWALTSGIVIIVLLYRQLPQPWRGILDAGVVLGLAWGMLATIWHLALALRKGPQADPQITR